MDDFDNEFNFSSGQDEESDVELLASISTSTRATSNSALSTPNPNFFERYMASELLDNQEVEVEKVFCKFEDCDTEYVWKGSTTNLITHLRDIHQITKESLKNKLVKAKQQTIHQVISRPHSSYIQKKLTNQLVRYIIARAQPIYIVEDKDFRLWTKNLDPRFQVPCVDTIKTIIFNSYDSAVSQIKDLISKTSDTVSLTFDLWSSRAHDSYLGITCHWLTDSFDLHEIVLDMGELDEHHASDIVESVNSVLNKFNINCQKVFSITTDNGSNVKSAVQQMGISNVKCAGHTLQLSVNLGLKEVDEIISKYFSGLKEPLDVIKDVDTRWNSTFYAIERLVYLKPAIIQLYTTLTNHTIREIRKGAETMGPYIPSSEEFELLKQLIEILSPFDEATQFLSGSKYPTLGFMTPILEELARRLRYFTGQNSMAILVKDTILDNLIKRWGDPSEIGMCCSFLDPRFKKLNFCTSALRCTTIQNMRRQFNELCSNDNTTSTTNDDNPSSTSSHQRKKTKISSFFTHLQTENSNVEPDEFEQYCEVSEVSLDEAPSESFNSLEFCGCLSLFRLNSTYTLLKVE
ncbi:18110_t:CDS:2, partial [Gigaspora rosea]